MFYVCSSYISDKSYVRTVSWWYTQCLEFASKYFSGNVGVGQGVVDEYTDETAMSLIN